MLEGEKGGQEYLEHWRQHNIHIKLQTLWPEICCEANLNIEYVVLIYMYIYLHNHLEIHTYPKRRVLKKDETFQCTRCVERSLRWQCGINTNWPPPQQGQPNSCSITICTLQSYLVALSSRSNSWGQGHILLFKTLICDMTLK